MSEDVLCIVIRLWHRISADIVGSRSNLNISSRSRDTDKYFSAGQGECNAGKGQDKGDNFR